MEKNRIKRFVLFLLLAVSFLVLLIPLIYFTQKNVKRYENTGTLLDEHWDVIINDVVYNDVTLSEFTFPVTNKWDVLTLSRTLDEQFSLFDPVIKCDLVHCYVRVFLDDDEIYGYGEADYESGRFLGYGTHYIQLKDYLGKKLTFNLIVTENKAFNGIPAMIGGNRSELVISTIVTKIFVLATALALILFGIIMSVITLVMILKDPNMKQLYFIAVFSLLIGLWTLCNNDIMIYFTNSIKVKSYTEYLSLYALPIPLLAYFYPEITNIKRKPVFLILYRILFVSHSLFFITAVILQLLNIVHLPGMLQICHILMFLEILLIFAVTVNDLINRRRYKHAFQVGMVAILVMIAFELIRYNVGKYISSFLNNSFNSHLCFSVLFIVITLIVDYTLKIRHSLISGARQKILVDMAYTDELTGLYNRRKCDEIVEQLIDSNKDFGLVSMDLNLLKYFNDKYGHEKGDELLKTFAHILKEAFPDALVHARMGGDEFMIVLSSMETDEYESIIKHLNKIINEHNKVPGNIFISTAAGCVSRSEMGSYSDLRTMYQEADKRMYKNKNEIKKQLR